MRLPGKLLLFLLMGALSVHAPKAEAEETPPRSALRQLEIKSRGTLVAAWNPDTGTPAVLSGALTSPSKHTPQWIAREFLFRYKSLYGIRHPVRDLKTIGIENGDYGSKVHFKRILFGTPVWEDGLVFEIDRSGVIRRIEGTIHPHLEKKLNNRPMFPAVSPKKAVRSALSGAGEELAGEPLVERYYLASRTGTPLVYVVELRFRNPDRKTTAIVHSLTGKVVEQKNEPLGIRS